MNGFPGSPRSFRSWPTLLLITVILLVVGAHLFREVRKAGGLVDPSLLTRMDRSLVRPDDGDSFYYGDLTVRVVGMDTPEIRHVEHGLLEDQEFGPEAAAFTASLFETAEQIDYLPVGEDRYGRTLAHVFVDGELLSVLLIEAGLAYETVTVFGDNGFPTVADRILRAAKEAAPPPFENPYTWRKRHQATGD